MLAGEAQAGQRAVVLGSGLNGACVAEFLFERGHDVTMIKSSVPISAAAGILVRKEHTYALNQLGIRILTGARVVRIVKEGVVVEQIGQEPTLLADTVVLARGMQSVTDLARPIEALGIPVIRVGDAVEPREVLKAIHEGCHAGCSV